MPGPPKLPAATVCACQGAVSQPLRADTRKERGGQRATLLPPWVHQPDILSVCMFTCPLTFGVSFPFVYSCYSAPRGCLASLADRRDRIHPAHHLAGPSALLCCLDVYLCFWVFHLADHLNFNIIKSITLSFVSYYLCLLTQNFPDILSSSYAFSSNSFVFHVQLLFLCL